MLDVAEFSLVVHVCHAPSEPAGVDGSLGGRQRGGVEVVDCRTAVEL